MNDQVRAGIVARVSQDHEKENRSVGQQEDQCREDCATNRWTVADVFRHTGSASRFARKQNPEWQRLMRELPSLDVVVMWEPSRGQRRMTAWSEFLDQCQARSIKIHVHSHSRTYDLDNARDWRSLAEDGVDSAYESEKTSKRVKRALDAAAAEGRPHGKVAYGFRLAMDERKRHTRVIEPDEAAVVQRIFRDVARRVPLSEIARQLQAEGVRTLRQAEFSRTAVRRIIQNPYYMGMRNSSEGLVPGVWEAIVTEPEWHAANRVLNAIDRDLFTDKRPGEMKYLLSRIMTCGTCGSKMAARRKRAWTDESGDEQRDAWYNCPDWHASVREGIADAVIEAAAMARLNEPGVWVRFAPAADDDVAEAREAVEKVKDRIRETEVAIGSGDLPMASGARMIRDLSAQASEAQQALDDLAATQVREIWPNAEHWYLQTLLARREMVRALFEYIRCEPGRGAGRVTWEYRQLA
jgi:site-specific DNA recombinase